MRFIQLLEKPLYDILALALVAALFFGSFLGERPFSAPSESRYVEIGREMAETGDYITPRLNYVKYFEKPPLSYWVQAAWTKVAGVGFYASRVPTAFFAVLLTLLTYGIGRMLYGRLAGVLSAIVIASSVYLFALSRVVLTDLPVSVFLVATLSAFLYAIRTPPCRARTLMIYGMYVAAAGAVLTKGLIGMVLPGAVIFLWFLFTGQWKQLRDMRLPTGTLLFLLIAVPWHVLVWMHNPEHPHFYFIHEHLERYTSTVHGRYHPWWFFGAVLLAGLFPWLLFSYPALRDGLKGAWRERKTDHSRIFLGIWIIFIFLFFSASDSKLIPYILPIFPPLAAMIGNYLAKLWSEQPGVSKRSFHAGVFLFILILATIASLPLVLESIFDPDSKIAATLMQGGDNLHMLSIASLTSAVLLLIVYIQGRTRHVIMAFACVATIVLQLSDRVAANYNKDSMYEFAQTIKSITKLDDEVVAYDNYYQDLPIYFNRRISIVNWWKTSKSELQFGTQHENVSDWMYDYDEFWKRWMTPNHRMFAIMRQEAFERIKAEGKNPKEYNLYLLMQVGRNMLFTNVPPETLAGKKK